MRRGDLFWFEPDRVRGYEPSGQRLHPSDVLLRAGTAGLASDFVLDIER